jgi:hypothetical protein
MPGAVYKKVRSRYWTSIDIGLKPDLDNPAVETFTEHRAWAILEEAAGFCAPPGSKRLKLTIQTSVKFL